MRRYMMGDDYMAAPVLNLGQRARMVYFPLGVDWTHHYTVRHTDNGVKSQHLDQLLLLHSSSQSSRFSSY
jgi:alpha-glucosidase (family GH31 glycosyl hydrolase)